MFYICFAKEPNANDSYLLLGDEDLSLKTSRVATNLVKSKNNA